MTSVVGANAVVDKTLAKTRYLKVDKEGVPLNLQVPLTTQVVTATGGTITFTGARIVPVLTALVGVLTINATSHLGLIGREITVYVRGGVGQNVVINFPAAGYPVYVNGVAGASTTYTIAASANNQAASIRFGPTAGFVTIP